jgi:iron uptake system component EfeO
MLPTFVIGLREGLEAALIVGIIAAFLRKHGRTDLLRSVLTGVAIALGICVAVGVALEVVSRDLPQRQQEGLETVVGLLAVALVTYMVVWMRRHAHELKGQLEARAAGALSGASNAGRAMVVMAFLAVIREGMETVIFLLAAFDESGNGATAGFGALLGIVAATGLGYGIYRGGARLNLSRFFRATGLVLVLVAGGIFVNALHTAHEAGWLDAGQAGTVDLTWLVRPGTVLASLLNGMLGVQPKPVLIEIVGWLLYVLPVGWYVAWPAGKRSPTRWLAPALALGTTVAAITTVVAFVPDEPGVARAAAPAGGWSSAARSVTVTITAADGCAPDAAVLRAGAVTFLIDNVDATAVSEVELLRGQRIVGEKENVPPGFTGTFTVTVAAGSYTLYCPGADPDRRALTVTGAASGSPDDTTAHLLADGTKSYGDYVSTQIDALLLASRRLASALHGTSLAAAQRAYIAARPFYERIEPVAESFVVGTDSIDADLDAREGDVPAAKWRGFHRIEKALFQTRTLAGTGRYGELLVKDVKRLQKLTSGLPFQPTELANGAQELLDEVAASKITGEEERYSHIDVLDIANNVEGAQQAFAELAPAVRRIDAELARTIATALSALDSLVDTYRTGSNPSGFVLFGELTRADKTGLAATVKAVQEPLSRVAAKVANA